MRSFAKQALEKAGAASGLPSLLRRFGTRDRVILAYHNVVPDRSPPLGEASLHLELGNFRAQLDFLQDHFDVIPLTELLQTTEREEKPRASITFDDAYRGCLELALGELVERGVPATIFVAPGLLGGGAFWWDILADPQAGRLDPSLRVHILQRLHGHQPRVLKWAAEEGLKRNELTPLYHAATSEEVEETGKRPGISIDSHTWSHVNLGSMEAADMENELTQPLQWLRDRSLPGTGILSYPYGFPPRDDTDPMKKAGYAFGLLIQGGPISFSMIGSRPFHIPRLNIPRGLSLKGFELKISGAWFR